MSNTAPLSSTPTPAAPLGHTAARGFAYFLAQGLIVKLINTVGQIVLAWLLDRQDFGYVGLALGVAFFASLIQNAGTREILVQRGRHFSRWANAAFWMSLGLGVTSSGLMLAAAPLAAAFYHDPRLVGLICVLAVSNLLQSLNTVPDARLQSQLRFRMLATVGLFTAVGTMGLSIVFAAMGMGAYSFLLPLPIVEAGRALVLWSVARPPVRLRLQARRWRYMATDSAMLLLAGFFLAITWQADFIILGRLYQEKAVVGLYFWARSFSTQALQLLALNVAGVLFPSLAKLQGEPQRQLAAFLRAARALAILAVPACFLQAALADPLVRLLFREDWRAGIPLVQVLSVGWALFASTHAATSMLKAQGRFRLLTAYGMLSAALFVTLAYVGASGGRGGMGAAWGVAAYAWLTGPLGVYLAIRPLGGTWRDTVAIFAAPVLVGAAATGAAVGAGMAVPQVGDRLRPILQTLVILPVAAGLYAAMIRKAMPAPWEDLVLRLGALTGRQRPR